MSKYIDLANQYIEDVLKGRVDACKWVKLACKRHKKDLKNSSKRDYPYKFDIQKAEKPCKFIELLKHVKGPKAGENIVLEPWECFILCCIFGWVKKSNGFRRFKVAYIEVPRGTLYHSYALESGRVRHCIIRTPSMANIGAMQYACIGDQITDAQLCIVQCDPCFTCTDRAIEIIRR